MELNISPLKSYFFNPFNMELKKGEDSNRTQFIKTHFEKK